MELCTIDDVSTYLGVDYDPSSGSSVVDQINYLIPAVSDNIRKICNRNLTAADTDESYDIDGSEVLLIDNPIISITSVEYGSPFGTDDLTEVTSDDYITYDKLGIVALNLTIRRQKQYVRVVARLGYEEVPDNLNLIAVEEVVRSLKQTTQDTNLKSIKTGDAAVTYNVTSESQSNLINKLNKYIKSC